MEVVVSLSQGRTAATQCGLFTHKSVPVIFEPPCTYNVTLRRLHATVAAVGQQKIVTYSDSVYSLRYPACNARALYCHLQTVRLYSIISHYLTQGTIFLKKVTEHKMSVLILSTNFE